MQLSNFFLLLPNDIYTAHFPVISTFYSIVFQAYSNIQKLNFIFMDLFNKWEKVRSFLICMFFTLRKRGLCKASKIQLFWNSLIYQAVTQPQSKLFSHLFCNQSKLNAIYIYIYIYIYTCYNTITYIYTYITCIYIYTCYNTVVYMIY